MKQGHEVRFEKVAWKDIKMRTFITSGDMRNDLAAHVYDVTYGIVRPGVDNIVVIDDSIVRGTTLHESIIRSLERLQPKKIVIVSSAPQIRYPDYYGIDMPHLEELAAFRACIQRLKEQGRGQLIDEVYQESKKQLTKPVALQTLPLKRLYAEFTDAEISETMAVMLSPEDSDIPVEIVFQSVEGLHRACPGHLGDWFFTGDYPTPGGIKMCNEAMVSYVESVPEFRQDV